MPELPEVETIKSGLQRRIKGLKISAVDVRFGGIFKGDKNNLLGVEVKDINRRAKILIIDLSNNYSLLVHLKMTGQLVFQSADEKVKVVGGHPQAEYNKPLPHAHTHIILAFEGGSHLYFNDLRRFGWMMVVPTSEVANEPGISKAGPEPLSDEFETEKTKVIAKIQKSRKAISTVLMDQSVIAGIGNIYANEILYESKIMPDRPSSSLSEEEVSCLFIAIPKILKLGLAHGGTSDSTYVGVDGERGDYLKVAMVYHQEKDPKGHIIQHKKINARTAHFCPICQK